MYVYKYIYILAFKYPNYKWNVLALCDFQIFFKCETYCSNESVQRSLWGEKQKEKPDIAEEMIFYLVHGSLQRIVDISLKTSDN